MMNKKIILYAAISWGLAMWLFVWGFMPALMAQLLSSSIPPDYNLAVQQINSSNINLSEKAIYLEAVQNVYQQAMQINQIFVPISLNQFPEIELILIVPPLILLLLAAYLSKDNENIP